MVREHVLVTKVRGFEARRALAIYEPTNSSQVKPGKGLAVPSYVHMLNIQLNSAIEQELRNRRVEDRVTATSSA